MGYKMYALFLSTKFVPYTLINPMFRALIRCIKLLLWPTNVLGFMNVILVQNNHQHVSATHLVIFNVVRYRIQI